ncbi:serine protease SPPA, chloroplastic-like [Malus sylvestris]|uniref:serine protease SPPA, chloroplastic-like n=1 Tax=Malus sylvestris TaxID=3752 RepID=UPI0021AC9AD5|nr:serine protease SPPA, chloroplastic-like [Malus sylvestris]
MSKLILLHTSYHLTPIHRRACNAVVSPSLFTPSSLRSQCLRLQSISPSPPLSLRSISARAFDSSSPETKEVESKESDGEIVIKTTTADTKEYPSGEFQFEKATAWKSFVVKLRMLTAFPWQRVKKGSVLTIKLRGQVSDQLKSRFSSGLSLPQICENLMKAAYDPRIPGVYLQIESLNCGWGKVEEIRRHILDFKKSGKFVVAYVPACGEKEYYLASACQEIYAPPSAYFSLFGLTVQSSFIRGVLEKVGIEPQVERIGKYKSAGDQLARTTMSEENCEMLTALLDNIYGNWLDVISSTRGKKREDIENFINEGVYQVEKLKEEGWITNIQYDDEVISMLKERLGVQKEKTLPMVDYRKYSKVQQWTVGLSGGKDKIAIIRASGSISRVQGGVSLPGSSIIGEQFIEKIRTVRESKRYKAAIIRIDSPGGDALASDLMWREIRLLAASKPVIASMSDVAASGGYYMAMAADAIVAENLTLTGSIGVVTGKFNLGKLYEKIGFNKEIISRGKYAEVLAAEQRSFRPEEAEIFAKSAQNAYKQFRDKAALSRSMTVDKMEEVAQGRVWTGNDAASRGLVDAIGGLSRAVAIAKLKANIPQDKQVALVELARPSPTLPEILSGIGASLVGVDRTMKEVLQELTFSGGVQARMEGIMFQRLEGASQANPIFSLFKDYFGSL